MTDFLSSIRRFLFSRVNREFLIFLFFLAIAGIFWVLTTLNESFEQELKVPVRFVNVPDNVVITSGDNDTLRFTVRDKGISLVTYLYNKEQKPVSIDFKRYAGDDGMGTVPAADLLKLLDATLPASAKSVSVKPDAQVFYYNNGEKKTVPIVLRAKVEPDAAYYIADTVFSATSITIYASPDKLDSINEVYTELLRYKDFRDSLVVRARLQPIAGVKMVPAEISVCFHADMLTESRIEGVEVKGINMPAGKVLRTFPARMAVTVVTGMKNYQTLSAADFEIVADYNQLIADSSSQCQVFISRQPAGIKRIRLERQTIDYLIEDHADSDEK